MKITADTNVLVRAAIADHPEQATIAADLLRNAEIVAVTSRAQAGRPLTAEFPRDSVVRLHLGVLLLWSRQVAKGKEQLRIAAAEQPGSVYAKQARELLKALGRT